MDKGSLGSTWPTLHGLIAVDQQRRNMAQLAAYPAVTLLSTGCCKKSCGVLKVCKGAHSHMARAIHLYVLFHCCLIYISLSQSVLRLMPFFFNNRLFFMMRLELSAPLNLLTYTVLYLSLTHASCYSVR